MKRLYIPLNVAGSYILDADVLSYRTPGLLRGDVLGKAIAIAGRGEECHTAVACREGGDLVALGMRFLRQKLKLLVDEVLANPGLIDVYRYVGYTRWQGQPSYEPPAVHVKTRKAIVDTVRRFALHGHYGTWDVIKSSAYFIPGVRWLANVHPYDDPHTVNSPFCSMAVAYAIGTQASPLLQNRTYSQMLPGDVVTSPLLAYMFTLEKPTDLPMDIDWYVRKAMYGEAVASRSSGLPMRRAA